MYIDFHVKYACKILMKLQFSDRFSTNAQILDFVKIRPVEADLFQADGQADMTKLIAAFRNFANAPKNRLDYLQCEIWKTNCRLRKIFEINGG